MVSFERERGCEGQMGGRNSCDIFAWEMDEEDEERRSGALV
jgi:hypothetical protein